MEELLKQMLAEIKELKAGQARIEAATTRIEYNHGTMLKALIDAREVQQDVNDMIIEKLNTIAMKVDMSKSMLKSSI